MLLGVERPFGFILVLGLVAVAVLYLRPTKLKQVANDANDEVEIGYRVTFDRLPPTSVVLGSHEQP